MPNHGDDRANQRFYGRWAPLYEVLAKAPGLRSSRDQTVAALDLSPGDIVVEMGCGTGANIPHIRERIGTDGRIVGMDITRAMVKHAARHPERTGSGVHYLQGDASRPPLEDADAVLATFVVGSFTEPGPVVAEWCDLLDSGGRSALLHFQRSEHRLAVPLNLLFEAFVRLSAPGKRLRLASQARVFEERLDTAREVLIEHTDDHHSETFAHGYLSLISGRVL